MNLKRLPIEFDAKAVSGEGVFEGYASTFGNVDRVGDIVMAGAFMESLSQRPAAKIKMLRDHDPSRIVGVWTNAAEDRIGLHVKGRLLLSTPLGAETYELMKAGALDSMSIGYITKDSDYDARSNVRSLKTVELHEVSLVTFPANEAASVQTVKELDFNPRNLEDGLREVGLSRSDAKKAVAVFKERLCDAGEAPNAGPRDADQAALEAAKAVAAMRELIQSIRA